MTSPRSMTIESAERLIKTNTQDVCDKQFVKDPQVSVCLITYNHRQYIRQAIRGVLSPKISVPFEIVIGDDCSDDGTTELVRDLQREYPERIRLLVAAQNFGCCCKDRRTAVMSAKPARTHTLTSNCV